MTLANGSRARNQRPSMRVLLARTLLLYLCLVGATACRDAPLTVLADARQALNNKDEAGFLALCEPRSAEVLRQGQVVSSKSGKIWRVLRDGHPTPALLPKGEPNEPVEQHHVVVIPVVQGTKKSNVVMRLVEGQWRLSLLDMDSFWQLTRPGE